MAKFYKKEIKIIGVYSDMGMYEEKEITQWLDEDEAENLFLKLQEEYKKSLYVIQKLERYILINK